MTVKVDFVKGKNGVDKIHFEARQNEDGTQELDELYAALLGSENKRGGYTSSYAFVVEVKRGVDE